MTIDELRARHSARPFQPFIINLADGRRFRVDHPEFLAQSPGGRTLYVAPREGGLEIIDLLMVTSLTLANGKPHRSRRRD